MDLSKPDGRGLVKIVSIEPGEGYTKILFEGPVDGYGTAYISQKFTSIDSTENSGTMMGDARVIMEDGTLVTSPLRGTFWRNGKNIKVFFTDAVSNGDYNFVTWDIDLIDRSADIKYFRLISANP
ncbi:MAG: hypothetical protein CMQ41_03815 [Gammaproteobacteria bacterium]|nr:hypothetical protein [Gammaproteobacteria bacterium]|tara:strand:+ start:37 stop:411 length:375 start_codon:yes stop_codon:yes gene_type:complete